MFRQRPGPLFLTGLAGCLVLLLAACNSFPFAGNPSQPSSSARVTSQSASIQSVSSLHLKLACKGSKEGNIQGFVVDTSHARVCAYADPSSTLTITVSFCGGKADPSAILQKSVMVDHSGYYEWNWKPQADCNRKPISDGNIQITERLKGQETTEVVAFSLFKITTPDNNS